MVHKSGIGVTRRAVLPSTTALGRQCSSLTLCPELSDADADDGHAQAATFSDRAHMPGSATYAATAHLDDTVPASSGDVAGPEPLVNVLQSIAQAEPRYVGNVSP